MGILKEKEPVKCGLEPYLNVFERGREKERVRVRRETDETSGKVREETRERRERDHTEKCDMVRRQGREREIHREKRHKKGMIICICTE